MPRRSEAPVADRRLGNRTERRCPIPRQERGDTRPLSTYTLEHLIKNDAHCPTRFGHIAPERGKSSVCFRSKQFRILRGDLLQIRASRSVLRTRQVNERLKNDLL